MHNKNKVTTLIVLLTGVFFLQTSAFASKGTMSIALPANVIKQSLQDILPLKLDEPNRYLEGLLILKSIDKLVMGENSAVIQGVLLGKNLSVITRVGNQDLRIKVGNLHLPLTCDLAFRFDPKSKRLLVKPRIRPPAASSPADMANSVTSLLTLFNNREYPISLDSFKTLNAKVGSQNILVNMVPVDIRVTKGQLVVKMLPRLRKSKPKTN